MRCPTMRMTNGRTKGPSSHPETRRTLTSCQVSENPASRLPGHSTDLQLDHDPDMLASGGFNKYMTGDDDDDDEEADEQDLQDDPIWQLDLHVRRARNRSLSVSSGGADEVGDRQAHLKSFFHQAYEADQTGFRRLAEIYLTEEEKGVLTQLLQSA